MCRVVSASTQRRVSTAEATVAGAEQRLDEVCVPVHRARSFRTGAVGCDLGVVWSDAQQNGALPPLTGGRLRRPDLVTGEGKSQTHLELDVLFEQRSRMSLRCRPFRRTPVLARIARVSSILIPVTLPRDFVCACVLRVLVPPRAAPPAVLRPVCRVFFLFFFVVQQALKALEAARKALDACSEDLCVLDRKKNQVSQLSSQQPDEKKSGVACRSPVIDSGAQHR